FARSLRQPVSFRSVSDLCALVEERPDRARSASDLRFTPPPGFAGAGQAPGGSRLRRCGDLEPLPRGGRPRPRLLGAGWPARPSRARGGANAAGANAAGALATASVLFSLRPDQEIGTPKIGTPTRHNLLHHGDSHESHRGNYSSGTLGSRADGAQAT